MIWLLRAIFLKGDELVSDQVIITFAQCIKNGFSVMELFKLPSVFLKQLFSYCMSTLSREVQFFGKYLTHELVAVMQPGITNYSTFGTGGLFIGSENMVVRYSKTLTHREIIHGGSKLSAMIFQYP